MADALPLEPEAFTEHIAGLLAQQAGHGEVQLTGPLELTWEGMRVSVKDLHRGVHSDQAPADPAATVLRFIRSVIHARQLDQLVLPFPMVEKRILPRICAADELGPGDTQFIAHQAFVHDTLILYVVCLGDATRPVSVEQMICWELDLESLDRIARRNLRNLQPRLPLRLMANDEGATARIDTGDGYDASRLLLEQLHPNLAPELGGNFLVAIPCRDVFVAFPTGAPKLLDRLRDHARNNYRRQPYPITDDLFLVTRDGVAAWWPAA
ncbi:MAG: DUF1444 family protein [Phycisphaerae bacterium]|nr:DUF1444 family protein [Phycisphaerae bacterium]